jgi:hypothetical protein
LTENTLYIRKNTKRDTGLRRRYLNAFCIILLLGAGYFYLKTLWRSPVSPPETEIGRNVFFDSILQKADKNWLFIFQSSGKIVLTDIYANKSETLFDIHKESGTPHSYIGYKASLSPEGKYIVLDAYINKEDGKNDFRPMTFLLNIPERSFQRLTIDKSSNNAESEEIRNFYWLNSSVLILVVEEFLESYQRLSITRFDVCNANNPEFINIEAINPSYCFCKDTMSFVFKADFGHDKGWLTNAIDIDGLRTATFEEEKCYEQSQLFKNELKANDNAPRIEVKCVMNPPALEGPSYYVKNSQRYYVLLDGKVVRITDSPFVGFPEICWNRVPVWDSDMQLFIWNEEANFEIPHRVFIMDRKGNYLQWYIGHYLGKVPRSLTNLEILGTQ